ncbi:hypothetical protein J7E32_19915 [Bacillus sp. ISL-55]|nr:hypothetical protein [Bacillus sp. ISL-55]
MELLRTALEQIQVKLSEPGATSDNFKAIQPKAVRTIAVKKIPSIFRGDRVDL